MIKLAPTSLKIHQIIRHSTEGALVPRPEFQRRLVWSHLDKINFIDTIIRQYPFPEIYLADGNVDLVTGDGTQLLVDGQQRVTTILDYFSGDLKRKPEDPIRSYVDLTDEQKKNFLQYDVAVRNLGAISVEEIKEVFRRINLTSYSLSDMEINHAIYAGRFKRLSERLAELPFFSEKRFFRPSQIKRMGDTKYVASILSTMIGGYFNRDDLLEEYLSRFNEEFPDEGKIEKRFKRAITVVSDLSLPEKSRAWKQTDFFTLVCEIDFTLEKIGDVDIVGTSKGLKTFYEEVDRISIRQSEAGQASKDVLVYYRASIQAANDRVSRVRRANAIRPMILSVGSPEERFELGN